MRKFFACMALFMVVTLLSACGDDDSDSSSSSELINKKLGKLVKAVGPYRFYYDNEGRLDYFTKNSQLVEFSYNPDQIDGISASYTSQGFLKSLSSNTGNMTLSANYSYDGAGHLTKLSASYKSGNESYKSEVKLTWKNNLLTNIIWVDEDLDKGGIEKDTYSMVFKYDEESKDDYYNEYAQFAPSLFHFAGIGDGEVEKAMAYIGKLGVGTQYLPSGMDEEWTEEDNGNVSKGTSSRNYSYIFNTDGTLSCVIDGNTRYNYVYESIDTNN